MNQHFNSTRFGRLLRKHTAEHLPSYAMSTAVLAGGVLVVLSSLTYITRRPLQYEVQLILFVAGLLAAGAIFTSSVFADLGNPRGAAPALLLPASHLEKYLVAWLYSLPVFLVVYTAVFMALNLLVLQLGSQGRPYDVYDFSHKVSEWASPLLSYALLHSVALWGAIFFRRLHVIKTAFLVFGSVVVLIIANLQLLKTLLPIKMAIPFSDVWVRIGEANGPAQHDATLALPDSQQQLVVLLVPLALTTLLWLAAYARLTEKQI